MPANVDIDDVDLNEGRNGGGRVPAWEKFMRSKGATDDEVAEARRDNQRDLTRARQKDTQKLTTLEQRLANVERGSMVPQGPVAQKFPWDEVLEKHGLDKNAPALKEMMAEYGKAIAQSVLAASQANARQDMAPIVQTLHQSRLMSERDSLTKKFGEKRIADLWPDIESELQTRLARGEQFESVEDVFRKAMPDEYTDAFYAAETARRRSANEANKSKSSEGFIQTQRSQPVAIADSRPSTEEVIDYEKITQDSIQEALREVGLVN